ncbi:uncharacterized protein LOC112680106 [Sipha flava]|uniref:Uncharacterized protein LOC112680106 n=1 Tax=Sipha flava TaxID=143950 RepID=A0A8B8F504_9HEMI|nr:uncharacterized protein LOC112680106 [Sipha flava]
MAMEREEMHADRGASRRDCRERTMVRWKKRIETAETGSWTRIVIPDLNAWCYRRYGLVDFHLTQMLSGHGCFGEYLQKRKRRDDPGCVDCGAASDDANNVFFRCDRWSRKRRSLEGVIGREFDPKTVVGAMLTGSKDWDAVQSFVNIMQQKREDEERDRQRAEAARQN